MAHCPRNTPDSSDSGDCALPSLIEEKVSVELLDVDMWKIFNNGLVNEMIITKAGRKLFPVVKFKVRGLNPQRMYSVSLEFEQQETHRWKYTEGGWTHAGKAEPPPSNTTYIHHNSPKFGDFWTAEEVDFSKVKITNKNSRDMIRLNSLHLYEPIVRISRVDPLAVNKEVIVFEKHLPMCQFMAVTSYQNPTITALKIKHNPFAKGFQDGFGGIRRSYVQDLEDADFVAPPNYYCQSSEIPAYNPSVYAWPGYSTPAPVTADSSSQSHPGFYFPSSLTSSSYSSRYSPYARPTIKTEKGLDLSYGKPSEYYYPNTQQSSRTVNPASSSYYTRSTTVAPKSTYPTDYGSTYSATSNNVEPYYAASHSSPYQYPYSQEDLYSSNSYYGNYQAAGYASYYSRSSAAASYASLDQTARVQRYHYSDSESSSSGSPVYSTTSDQISPTENQTFVY